MRVPIISSSSTILLIFLLSLPATTACQGAAARGGTAPVRAQAFDRKEDHLYHTQASGAKESIRAVIRDSASLEAMWERINLKAFTTRVLRPNLRDSMLLVAALGPEGAYGPSIRLDSIHTSATENVVSVLIFRPDRKCSLPSGMSSPIDIVILPRNELPVRFVEQTLLAERCGGNTPRSQP
jgi:hypothetical protein